MVGYVFRSQILSMLDKGIGFLTKMRRATTWTLRAGEVLRMVEDLKNVPVKRDESAGRGDQLAEPGGRGVQARPEALYAARPVHRVQHRECCKGLPAVPEDGPEPPLRRPAGPQARDWGDHPWDLTFENCQLQLGERASFEMKSVARAQGGDDPPSPTSGSVQGRG